MGYMKFIMLRVEGKVIVVALWVENACTTLDGGGGGMFMIG